MGNGMSKHPAGAGCCLEATRAPAAIEIQSLDGHLADDRTGIRADINNAAPLAHQSQATEHRKQFTHGLDGALDYLETAALTVPGEMVDTRTNHQLAFIGLRDITVYSVGHHHSV